MLQQRGIETEWFYNPQGAVFWGPVLTTALFGNEMGQVHLCTGKFQKLQITWLRLSAQELNSVSNSVSQCWTAHLLGPALSPSKTRPLQFPMPGDNSQRAAQPCWAVTDWFSRRSFSPQGFCPFPEDKTMLYFQGWACSCLDGSRECSWAMSNAHLFLPAVSWRQECTCSWQPHGDAHHISCVLGVSCFLNYKLPHENL